MESEQSHRSYGGRSNRRICTVMSRKNIFVDGNPLAPIFPFVSQPRNLHTSTVIGRKTSQSVFLHIIYFLKRSSNLIFSHGLWSVFIHKQRNHFSNLKMEVALGCTSNYKFEECLRSLWMNSCFSWSVGSRCPTSRARFFCLFQYDSLFFKVVVSAGLILLGLILLRNHW